MKSILKAKNINKTLNNNKILTNVNITINEGEIISTGGRVLSCSATGDPVYEAAFKAYQMMDSISLEGSHFRKDIGFRAL